jgi:hypothetical protein
MVGDSSEPGILPLAIQQVFATIDEVMTVRLQRQKSWCR